MFSIDGPEETEERRCLVLPHTLNFRDYLAFRRNEQLLEIARCSSDPEEKWVNCRFSMRTEIKQKKQTIPEKAPPILATLTSPDFPEAQTHLPEMMPSSDSSSSVPTQTNSSVTQGPQQNTHSQHILHKLASERDPLRIVDPFSAPLVPFVAPNIPPGSLSEFPHFNQPS